MMYQLLAWFLRLIFRIAFRLQVTGTEHILSSGGAIIAANHISLLDPPVLGVAITRKVHFMAKKELFANPLFAWLITQLKAFPVQRGAPDRVAIRTAISLLSTGELVGIFPEGTRSKTGILRAPEPGVALIAAKAGAPIVPAAIIGTNKVRFGLRQPSFIVAFGCPIQPEQGKTDRETLEKLGSAIMNSIADLVARNTPSAEK